MSESKEMKEFNEKQYQLWLEENKEFLTRFIVENMQLETDEYSWYEGGHRNSRITLNIKLDEELVTTEQFYT